MFVLDSFDQLINANPLVAERYANMILQYQHGALLDLRSAAICMGICLGVILICIGCICYDKWVKRFMSDWTFAVAGSLAGVIIFLLLLSVRYQAYEQLRNSEIMAKRDLIQQLLPKPTK